MASVFTKGETTLLLLLSCFTDSTCGFKLVERLGIDFSASYLHQFILGEGPLDPPFSILDLPLLSINNSRYFVQNC